MKSLKLVMIAALLATAIVNQAATDGFKANPVKKVIEINVLHAVHVPSLAEAIKSQVNHDIFLNDKQIYTVEVSYMNRIFLVYGTFEQWRWFFAPRLENKSSTIAISRSR